MNFFLFTLFFVVIGITLVIWRKRLGRRGINNQPFKRRMTTWMDMTSDERRLLDNQEKEKSMQRKKVLLSKIREEYSEVRKSHKDQSRPPFKPIR